MLKNPLSYHFYSLGMHVLLIAAAFLVTKQVQELSSDASVISSKMRIVGKAIKVDLVAMPKMTIQELQKAEPSVGEDIPTLKILDKGGDEKTVFKKKKKGSFADMLKQLSARKTKKSKMKKAKKVAKKRGAGGIKGKSLKKILALGNQISKGTSLTGAGAYQNTNDSFDRFAVLVMEKVKEHWRLPGYLANKDFSCHVRIYIDRSGKLLKTKIIKSSGNGDYDQRAVGSIKSTLRFDKPGAEIVSRITAGEIVLAFPL